MSKQKLTKRENEVAQMLAEGLLYKEIAERLGISIDTVKKHCKNIFAKLNARNRTEVTNYIHNKKSA
jgi:two-component system, NarL family, response regulator LiaR